LVTYKIEGKMNKSLYLHITTNYVEVCKYVQYRSWCSGIYT